MNGAGGCRICDEVDGVARLELDLLLSDSRRWPKELLATWNLPPGMLPARYKAWGAMRLGLNWLRDHGHPTISKSTVFRHWRYDVPIVVESDADVAELGQMSAADGRRAGRDLAPINPRRFLDFYAQGIEVGITGLAALQKRLDDALKSNEPVPMGLIELAINAGARLSMSQAALRKQAISGEDVDEDEGFRLAAGPIGPRIGHGRTRTIDGVNRHVRDEGPADRARFNERARQDGGVLLPEQG